MAKIETTDVINSQNPGKNISKVKTKEKMPWKVILPYFLMLVCEYISMLSTNSYVGDLIVDISLVSQKKEAGIWTGLVTSCFYGANFFGSYVYGRLSDLYGRKRMFLIGNFCVMISLFLQCFISTQSSYFYIYLIFCKLLSGFQGNLAILKTVVGETVPVSRTVEAFRLVGVSWGIASITVNILAGFLVRPTFQFPWIFESSSGIVQFVKYSLDKFPYFIPNFLVSWLYLICFSFCLFYMRETCEIYLTKRGIRREEIQHENIKNSSKERSEKISNLNVEEDDKKYNSKTEKAVGKKEIKVINDGDTLPNVNKMEEKTQPQIVPLKSSKFSSFREKYLIPAQAISLYTLMGWIGLSMNAVVPVFVFMPIENRGLGFSNWEIGILEMIAGVAVIIFQYFIVPFVVKRTGILWGVRIFAFLVIFVIPFYPELSYLLLVDSIFTYIIMWILLSFFVIIRYGFNQIIFTSTIVGINNSVTNDKKGMLNGISQTCIALTRGLGPWIGTVLLSVGTIVNVFPFDIHFLFILSCLIYLVLIFATIGLPKSLNLPKKEIRDVEKLNEILESKLEEESMGDKKEE